MSDNNLNKMFEGHRLITQLLKCPLYYNDIKRGLRLGLSMEEIVRVYEEYVEDTNLKSYQDYSGRSVKIEW